MVTLVLGLGAFLALDFRISSQQASAEDAAALTFQEYLGGLTGRLASIAGSSSSEKLPSDLADMLPRPPEGWTVRPAVADDVDAFLPKNRRDGEPKARDLVEAVGSARTSRGAEVVILTYEKGDRKVVIKAARYPDAIFTGLGALQQRFELQMAAPEYRGRNFMTVRGLDVTEDVLPDAMRGRLFMANVGGQIHLRILASKRMKDADLLPFFETLHVRALNAAVVDRQDGLGDVPVIVLASALGDNEREAYDADRAARGAAEAARWREERLAAEAEAGEAAKKTAAEVGTLNGEGTITTEGNSPSAGFASDCKAGDGGTKRCKVGD